MSLYVLSDLHLSTSDVTNKSMEVFGNAWNDYMNRIEKYWRAVIDDEDTVIVPGDVSWAMTMEEGLSDFKFIDSLPGRKILGKGNHDFWWSTMTKIKNFFEVNEIKTIESIVTIEAAEMVAINNRPRRRSGLIGLKGLRPQAQ